MKKQGTILLVLTVIFTVLLIGVFAGRYFDIFSSPSGSVNRYTEPTGPVTSEKINVNSASVQELRRLPNIGPALAQRIVDYRVEHGEFTEIEQLMDVSGIGANIFLDIAPYITVD